MNCPTSDVFHPGRRRETFFRPVSCVAPDPGDPPKSRVPDGEGPAMLYTYSDQNQDHIGSSFIGTFCDTPDHALIVLSGDIDAEVAARLWTHIGTVLAARTRFLTIDASAVTRCDPGLLDLLGRAQRRLARHHGLLSVRGLHPHLLPGVESPLRSVPDPASPGQGHTPQVTS